ncbi:MAG: hypothetical protein ABSB24_00610 [Gaiellaceae bacterium]
MNGIDNVSTTRTRLRSLWYPLVLFGAAALGAAGVAGADSKWVNAYWILAFVACFVAVGRYYAARGRRVGILCMGAVLVVGGLYALSREETP